MREDPRLLRSALGLRAANVRARARRAWERARGLHRRLIPAGAGPVRRDHGHEAVARHAEEPEAQEAAAPLPGHQDQALLQARHRAPRPAIPPRARELAADPSVGDLYLSEEQILERVSELGAQIEGDYADREPLLVAPLKASFVFLADLSRAVSIGHQLEFVELAGYGPRAATGGHSGIRLLKDLDVRIDGRDVLIVEDVVDTGLTLNYLVKTLSLRRPSSLAVATLLDRPYRRLVEDLPVRYVGFTVPDELLVGYGFDLDERFRNLPDLYFLRLPAD